MQKKKLSWAQALRFGRDAILSNPVRTIGLLSPISLVMLADIWHPHVYVMRILGPKGCHNGRVHDYSHAN